MKKYLDFVEIRANYCLFALVVFVRLWSLMQHKIMSEQERRKSEGITPRLFLSPAMVALACLAPP